MKTFRYPLGHEAHKTMTVSELRAKLAEYPDDLPVFAEWEGVHGTMEPRDFSIERHSAGRPDEECDALVINVNEY